MKKEEIQKQLLTVLEEAQRLQEKSELEMATAEFLSNESIKLVKKMNDESLSFEQKQDVAKQIAALHGRMEHEIREIEKGESRLLILEQQLDHFKNLMESNNTKN